jgi:DNA-binding NtrC family response regulator
MLTLYGDNDMIFEENLPVEIMRPDYNTSYPPIHLTELSENESLDKIISQVEKELIEKALQRANGMQSKAAQFLKTTRRVLRYKMNKLGITQQGIEK